MKLVQIIFAGFLFGCLANMPYGYFQFVRFAGMLLFGWLCYQNLESSQVPKAVIYFCLAILFQPFCKVHLGRELWNVIDVVVAIGLLIDAFSTKSKAE